jgi:3-hydroxybutyryl-CoA dehydrogenase
MTEARVAVLADSQHGVDLAEALRPKVADVRLYRVGRGAQTAAPLGAVVAGALLVVDATIWPEEKQRLVGELDRCLASSVPIVSLSLTAATTEIASWLRDPTRLCGFGYLPPLDAEGALEIAPGLDSGEAALAAAHQLAALLSKPTAVVKDGAGLVAARIVCPIVNEATYALEEGVATAEGIDTAVRLGANYPRGPLEWADLIGVDLVYAIMKGMHAEYGDDRYRPAPLLRKMTLAGRTGRSAGRGFYRYD